ncbi:hypothetical protein QBC35DRAFT_502373 [Podospora australis]|uniref:Uncharacterized protein n=1 Tax=Podospora australis TaxID=1536484 RepID=A0AAN7AHC4_9PEZI|nr:hypothetical protein QBC35DRAFT_502373 [Podospora australis]
MFLALILAVYLSLSLTKNIQSSEFTILLIILILFVTIFFCHSLIRLCMLVVKGRKGGDSDSGSNSSRSQLPEMQQSGPQCGGYAIPREPIRVVLARDEEAAGIESEATKTGPPAYGLWRESVRVDPNRIYWMRNQAASVSGEESEDFTEGSSDVSSLSSSSDSGRAEQTGDASTTRAGAVPRPPSYASDDGISYVVEARPRSTVLPPMATRRTMPSVRDTTYSAAGLHPAEAGRAGQPAAW